MSTRPISAFSMSVAIIPDSTWFHRDRTLVLEIVGIRVESEDVCSRVRAIDGSYRDKMLEGLSTA
jgi:hypothetical protein